MLVGLRGVRIGGGAELFDTAGRVGCVPGDWAPVSGAVSIAQHMLKVIC